MEWEWIGDGVGMECYLGYLEADDRVYSAAKRRRNSMGGQS